MKCLKSKKDVREGDLVRIARAGDVIPEVTERVKEFDQGAESAALSRQTFIFTGKLQDLTRQEAKDAVEGLGGRAASSVSGETDYVVAGEDPESKYEKAKEEKVK